MPKDLSAPLSLPSTTSGISLSGPSPNELIETNLKAPWETWKLRQTDQAATRTFMQALSPSIDKAITLNLGRPDPAMRGQAKLMAIKAMQTYDPTKASVATYLARHLQGLKRIAARRPHAIQLPERWLQGRQQIDEAEAELEEMLGRPPSLSELADHTKLSAKRINLLRGQVYPVATGTAAEGQADYLPVGLPGQDDAYEAWQEAVYQDLDPINQKIMEWTLGLGGQPQLSNMEIAKRLRLSPGAISQRKASIQRLLSEQLELSPFGS